MKMTSNMFALFSLFLATISAEKALSDYTILKGSPPSWLKGNEEALKKARTMRWAVDKKSAQCVEFEYLGSLGNFNNFASRMECLNHLKFKPEENIHACYLPKNEGLCELTGEHSMKRFYFGYATEGATIAYDEIKGCHAFNYTGCGGNANNFESYKDCTEACDPISVEESLGEINMDARLQNSFDCKFRAKVDTEDPKMGVVLHKNGKQCVYAAVAKKATRGFFTKLTDCSKLCIPPEKQVAACKETKPYQIPPATVITDNSKVKEFFYFDSDENLCLPFLSAPQLENEKTDWKIDDGSKNIFSSPEMCASFCPAYKQETDMTASTPCVQEKSGESNDGDSYKITRFYYDHTSKACKQFSFSGTNMNFNNFETSDACTKICKTPMSTS